MIEVLVTIVVISIALLGVAKMQAASISNTQDARVRSLVAMQASSLASAMHGNDTGYWGTNSAPATCSISGTTPCAALSAGASGDCMDASNPCSGLAMAKADMYVWVNAMNSAVPGYNAVVACTPTAVPVTCSILVSWNAKFVAINKQQSDNAVTTNSAATTQSNFTLLVTP